MGGGEPRPVKLKVTYQGPVPKYSPKASVRFPKVPIWSPSNVRPHVWSSRRVSFRFCESRRNPPGKPYAGRPELGPECFRVYGEP